MINGEKLLNLQQKLDGELHFDDFHKLLYATDASAYREIPLAVAIPRNKEDLKRLIGFANTEKTALIPRTAGTSLAGQVVGKGIVVDVSKHFTDILEINEKEHWVRVEPGVVLDELNKVVAEYALFFGPETSTANRCMMAGMVGNNSCGAHSLIYGSTRDHTISVKCLLSDGSEVEFGPISHEEYIAKLEGDRLENTIYRKLDELLTPKSVQEEIRKEFPDPRIERRNTGYAIDLLIESRPFNQKGKDLNLAKLIAGSEGTLALITEIKLNLVPLPPKHKGLLCVHCNTVADALKANNIALQFEPGSVELMDKVVMDCTKENISQRKNRFFIKGDPGAILIIEFARESEHEIIELAKAVEEAIRKEDLGYHFPLLFGADIPKVWTMRKAGLGLLSNVPGDAKPVPVVEDTAVHPEVLPDFIEEFDQNLDEHGLSCVYYAHVGSGELHLRPVLNLKEEKDVALFHTIAYKTALLVKKYNGSLSGEHGDGRLRGEFIPLMIGDKNFEIIREIKKVWDPDTIFNPEKIVDTPKMNTHLRYVPGQKEKDIKTHFHFKREQGIVRAVEKCNGSGDCRKSHIIGGTMCPSFMATRDEQNTTRARANILREFLTNSEKSNPFDHKEVYQVMDLCLSCKGCKSECPSNVDITKFKAEFLQNYYDSNGIPLRTKAIAYIAHLNKLALPFAGIYNMVISNKQLAGLMKSVLGFAKERSIPGIHRVSLKKWYKKNYDSLKPANPKKKVYLFADEFTDYNDTEIGITAIKLLTKLNYDVQIPDHTYSGRTFLSKGLLRTAKKHADQNILKLKDIINEDNVLLGIEPSAILSFRDEYPELVSTELVSDAERIAEYCLQIDEFLHEEAKAGRISKDLFKKDECIIKLHGHCHQKSLSTTFPTKAVLSLPENYEVDEIKSGCCGMAGSFGYEKEHYDLSMNVGELVLFPEVRLASPEMIISAPGTSCRHQIKDGTGKIALHPVEVLFQALKETRDSK